MIRPSRPWPSGRAPIALALHGRQAAGHELFDVVERTNDAQCRVLGPDELTHAIDDELKDLVYRLNLRNAAHGAVEGLELLPMQVRLVTR